MNICIIIPTYNEAERIAPLVQSIIAHRKKLPIRIVVCDGGSTDGTIKNAKEAGAEILISPERGRAAQMNWAAKTASEDVLYFIHADVKIHPDYADDIQSALQAGYDMGCYRFVFDSSHLLLKVNSFFTRFPFIWCRGGDQTLFIKRKVFEDLGGYRSMKIMEEYDLLRRAWKKNYRFKIIPKNIVVSARKYNNNSYFKVMYANYKIMKLWRKGETTDEQMATLYKQMLNPYT
jgi:rSAM/selenodomain-associated transferase 2